MIGETTSTLSMFIWRQSTPSGNASSAVRQRLQACAAQDVAELQGYLERRADTLADRAQRELAKRGVKEAEEMRAILEAQRDQVDDWIATELENYPVIAQLATIPGVGPVFSSGLGAEIGGVQRFLQGHKWDKKRKRYRSRNLRDAEDAVAKIAGLWWPRADSGDFEAQDRRLAKTGNRYLRYYVIQAANLMRKHISEYKAFYERKYKEASKHHHKRALVLTARKSVGLVVGLLHRDEPYRSKEDRRT